ncbi:MAG: hypothetical protein JWO44_548 [Bacteroidetes bacterium]|jgi:hypothetical protein|nr:hypothetical protein [Bacteroidota bacterium]
MKTITSKLFLGLLLITAAVFSPACKKEKDKQIPPELSFKTGSGYTSSSDSVGTNDTLLVGVNANKTEDKDLLQRFIVTQQYDANSATTILTESFNQDTYSKDMTIITRSVAGTEKYTYTIINRDGLTKTISLVLAVH